VNPVISKIVNAFEQRGSGRYGKESVTQLQHALQSGQLAEDSGADNRLITAALLHDIGHILGDHAMSTDCELNLDDKHEAIGYHFLRQHFGNAVADPVRLHVVAKRYLCTMNTEYEGKLSPTSLKSYQDQGGTMSADEVEQFEAEPYFREALRLRHWDDTAKDPDAAVPNLIDFMHFVELCLR
jgi:phosphonate degradation associated HDIG domain protein